MVLYHRADALVALRFNSEIEAASAEMRLAVQAPLVLGAEPEMMGL